MRISHKNKFIWISKPKTGSSSYRRMLDPFSDITNARQHPYHDHITLVALKSVFKDKGWDFENYYKIVPSRNPWSLLVSLYAYSKMDVNGKFFWSKPEDYLPDKLMSFSEFINLDSNWLWFDKRHTLKAYAKDEDGNVIADLIFSPEEEAELFFDEVQKHIGLELPRTNLQRLNTTEKSSTLLEEVRDNFSSDEIDKRMKTLFAWEIENFKYKNPYR